MRCELHGAAPVFCQRQADNRYACTVRPENASADSYAWEWFALHAAQRMQLVNFWLVAVAFLAAAFVQARASHLAAVAVGVSVVGTVASVAFMALDRRTRQLVHVAEAALLHLEATRIAHGEDEVLALVTSSRQLTRSSLESYRVVVQGLQLLVAITFLAGAIYSLASA
jgi:hypothetical protein